MKKKAPPKTYISQLEAKIKWLEEEKLEEEKEILNKAIDLSDAMLQTDIRKKYLPLLLNTTKQQQQQEKPARRPRRRVIQGNNITS